MQVYEAKDAKGLLLGEEVEAQSNPLNGEGKLTTLLFIKCS